MKAQDPYTFDPVNKLWRDARPSDAAPPRKTGLDEPFFFEMTALREEVPEEVVTAKGEGALEPYPAFGEEETTKVVVPTATRSRPPPERASLDDLFLPALVESASARADRLVE